jgi:hypothetical protein
MSSTVCTTILSPSDIDATNSSLCMYADIQRRFMIVSFLHLSSGGAAPIELSDLDIKDALRQLHLHTTTSIRTFVPYAATIWKRFDIIKHNFNFLLL